MECVKFHLGWLTNTVKLPVFGTKKAPNPRYLHGIGASDNFVMINRML